MRSFERSRKPRLDLIVVLRVFTHKNYAKTRHNGHCVRVVKTKGKVMKQDGLTHSPSWLTRVFILLGLSTVLSLGSTFISILMPQSMAMGNTTVVTTFANHTTAQFVLVAKP